MREFTYNNYLTLDDVKKETGYDIAARAEQGDFNSKEEAAKNFMQDTFEELKRIIASKMGIYWTNNFLSDILTDAETNEVIGQMAYGFREAYKELVVYRFEVGDPDAIGDSNTPRYSEKFIEILTLYRIVPRGI
jgi:uncharacterized protein YdbL (DUF1318 family)